MPLRLRVISGLVALCLVLTGALSMAEQANPVLSTATKRTMDAYLKKGPGKDELPDGSSSANWGLLRKVGIPELLHQSALQVGSWSTVWAPVTAELEKRGCGALDPLEAMTWWEETRKEPGRFLRLLASRGLVDIRVPKDRQRGEALRDALGVVAAKMEEVRANVRYERSGWSFTASVALVPSQRIIRIALSGSQPCGGTGRARTANLALKGRLFLDAATPEGVKVQILEDSFSSTGCEDTLNGRISESVPISLGGTARLSGSLVIEVKDNVLTGRLQLDVAYRTEGNALQTGHGVYSLRGSLAPNGSAQATLTPVSTSGSRDLREALEKSGSLEGQISKGQGAGALTMPLFRQAGSWRAARKV